VQRAVDILKQILTEQSLGVQGPPESVRICALTARMYAIVKNLRRDAQGFMRWTWGPAAGPMLTGRPTEDWFELGMQVGTSTHVTSPARSSVATVVPRASTQKKRPTCERNKQIIKEDWGNSGVVLWQVLQHHSRPCGGRERAARFG